MEEFDPVTKPKHYQGKYGLEAMTVIENFMWDLKGMAAADFKDVMKYLLRFQKKNGLQDLLKAEKYLKMLIEEQRKEEADG